MTPAAYDREIDAIRMGTTSPKRGNVAWVIRRLAAVMGMDQ